MAECDCHSFRSVCFLLFLRFLHLHLHLYLHLLPLPFPQPAILSPRVLPFLQPNMASFQEIPGLVYLKGDQAANHWLPPLPPPSSRNLINSLLQGNAEDKICGPCTLLSKSFMLRMNCWLQRGRVAQRNTYRDSTVFPSSFSFSGPNYSFLGRVFVFLILIRCCTFPHEVKSCLVVTVTSFQNVYM